MALYDLTPQLRTRLSRLERLVGLFIVAAAVLLLVGLAFYVRQLAKQKGWGVPKLPYFTFVRSAAGLAVGQRVKLMGLDVGEITQIVPQPPGSYYDMFIAFEVKKPFYGYLWDDSRVKVGTSDLLGNRFLELTKGTNGVATYLFHSFREVTLSEAEEALSATNKVLLVDEIYDDTRTNLVASPKDLLTRDLLTRISQTGSAATLRIIETVEETERPTGIWDFHKGRYEAPNFSEETRKGYFLLSDESPAIQQRLEEVANLVEAALPGVLDLTNHVQRALSQAATTATHADELLVQLQPVARDLAQITGGLSEQGSLGDWLLPTNIHRQISETLGSANTVVTNSDARLTAVATRLDATLENLANITSNLNAQVSANTNIVRELSALIVNADDMVQGLKRHWLLRSAFKNKTEDPRSSRPTSRDARSPRDGGRN